MASKTTVKATVPVVILLFAILFACPLLAQDDESHTFVGRSIIENGNVDDARGRALAIALREAAGFLLGTDVQNESGTADGESADSETHTEPIPLDRLFFEIVREEEVGGEFVVVLKAWLRAD